MLRRKLGFNYGQTLLLNPSDYVGVTFWIISAAMVAATFFFGWSVIALSESGDITYRSGHGYRHRGNPLLLHA